ncbi:rod shape-determining protein MreD [Sphingomonas sp.]|uniref:rod shape-determining protein MreD n=1 Tax=Sphingomonas sp. TaxID=28214 RepID=UPI0017D88C0A|nr:rod shape-determining protein MreD [Sphingomonas sp.]MBA3512048.1 rod shape-determining protein MreD [Sphingomonas sp.]
MVRTALNSGRQIGRGPRVAAAYIPAATVVAASFLSALPIVSTSGWYPDFGFLTLIAWRLLRSDPWPAWWAAPLGFANDLITGAPIGLSVAWWTATMLLLDLIDRRTIWRDYWIEWALAAVLLLLNEAVERWAAGMMGAALPIVSIAPPLLIAVFTFPIAAWIIGRLDHWRLGR